MSAAGASPSALEYLISRRLVYRIGDGFSPINADDKAMHVEMRLSRSGSSSQGPSIELQGQNRKFGWDGRSWRDSHSAS